MMIDLSGYARAEDGDGASGAACSQQKNASG
jgi:hypothetical protein